MKIISVSNNKGGVLKTTITANLAKFFSVDSKAKVLVLDTDPQGNIGIQFGFNTNQIKNTLATYSKYPAATIKKCVLSINPNLDIIASNIEWGLIPT